MENLEGQSAIQPIGGEQNPFLLEIGEIPIITADYLESENGSTTLAVMCKNMNLPSLLVEDVIELLIIKEWLIIPEDEV